MKIKFLLSLLLIVSSIHAQKEKKQWEDGPLTWDDFQDKKMQIYGSIPDFHFEYKHGYTKDKQNTYVRRVCFAYINTKKSYVTAYSKSTQILAYHQVEFDIIEYYTRVFEAEIIFDSDKATIEKKRNGILKEIDFRLYQYREATLYGARKKEIDSWNDNVQQLLKTQEKHIIPEIKHSHWSYGVYLGFEYAKFTKSFESYLNYKGGISLGIEINYKKSFLFIDGIGIMSSVKKDLFFKEQHIADKKTHFRQIGLSYGYNLINKTNFNLIPFVGIGSLTFMERTEEDDKFSKSTFSYNYGISFDYKFKNIYRFTSNHTTQKEQTTLFLRTRLFVNKAKFAENFYGNSINLGIIIGGNIRNFSINKQTQSQFSELNNSYQ